jgi:hypothetical protein
VTIDGDTYFDAVYITDGNLEEAVRRGADEIWAIWTVSRKNEYRDGFVAQYFHIIETVADTNFFTYWKRIEASNARIAAGQPGEFGRHITLHLIEAEVPIHYLLNFSRDRMAESVNKGVEDAREWCRARNIPLTPAPATPVLPPAPVTSLQFNEVMRGFMSTGTSASTRAEFEEAAARGRQADTDLAVHLTVSVADVDTFVTSPTHQARAEGAVESPLVGGRSPVHGGVINLLVDGADPQKKQMKYRLQFTGADGKDYTLVGFKDISGQSFAAAWPETTTLYTTLLSGRVAEGATGPVIASGIIAIRPEDFFFRQLFSFRVQGPSLAARVQGLNRFGMMFLGKLWDVYGHQVGPL